METLTASGIHAGLLLSAAGFFLVFLAVYGILIRGFAHYVRDFRKRPTRLQRHIAPDLRAAVILSLRGDDPFLDKCLRGIIEQDYSEYSVFVIVDSKRDASYARIAAFREETGHDFHVQFLTNIRSECGLKCSAILQVLGTLDGEYDFIALIDADTVPHPTWLRELAEPLREPRTGASTGNRWYVPQQGGWANITRKIWNIAALVQMERYGIAWGGSLAIRTDVIERCGLKRIWSKSFCEDAMIGDVIRKEGYELRFVPSVLMENRESCEFRQLVPWIRRQQRIGRLYSSKWPLILASIMFSLLPVLALVSAILHFAITREPSPLIFTASLYTLHHLVMTEWFIPWVQRALDKTPAGVGEGMAALPSARLGEKAMSFLAVTCLEVVSVYILATLYTRRTEEWRQIEYRVDGPFRVKMREYRPYTQTQPQGDGLSL